MFKSPQNYPHSLFDIHTAFLTSLIMKKFRFLMKSKNIGEEIGELEQIMID
jgi:hypothetical protein